MFRLIYPIGISEEVKANTRSKLSDYMKTFCPFCLNYYKDLIDFYHYDLIDYNGTIIGMCCYFRYSIIIIYTV